MEPIINPWMIYLIGNIHSANVALTIMTFGVCFITLFIWVTHYAEDEPLKAERLFFTPFAVFLIILATLTPNSKTLTAMVIANEVTYDRVDSLKATVGDIHNIVKQDIIEMIQEIKRDEVK